MQHIGGTMHSRPRAEADLGWCCHSNLQACLLQLLRLRGRPAQHLGVLLRTVVVSMMLAAVLPSALALKQTTVSSSLKDKHAESTQSFQQT